jgi:hypothetical protein
LCCSQIGRNWERGRTVSFVGIQRGFLYNEYIEQKLKLKPLANVFCPLKFSECPSHVTYYDAERHLKDILTTELLFPNPCLCVCLSIPLPLCVLYETVRFPSFMGGGSVSAGAGQYLLIKQLTEFHSPSDLQGENMEILLLLTVYRILCNALV